MVWGMVDDIEEYSAVGVFDYLDRAGFGMVEHGIRVRRLTAFFGVGINL